MAETPGGGPTNEPAASGWDAVLEDMAATADTYRERGWTTLELHPGDAALVDSEFRTGLDVVLSGTEFAELETHHDEATFTDVDVFRAQEDTMVYLLIAEQAPSEETVVFVPAYYDRTASASKLDAIQQDGELRLFCRQLNDDCVTFVHEDVAPFVPDDIHG